MSKIFLLLFVSLLTIIHVNVLLYKAFGFNDFSKRDINILININNINKLYFDKLKIIILYYKKISYIKAIY